jgi:glycosyltransferase involved in cell wall biosynthesis
MRILFVTKHTPLSWDDGAGAYLTAVAEALAAQGHRPTILWLNPHDWIRWRKGWRLQRHFENGIILKMKGAISLGGYYFFPDVFLLPAKARLYHKIKTMLRLLGFCSLGKPQPGDSQDAPECGSEPKVNWRTPPTRDELEFTRKTILKVKPDIVVANFSWLSTIFSLSEAKELRKVILCHDVQHEKSALMKDEQASFYSWELESRDLQFADTIFAISESDRERFSERLINAKIGVLPMASPIRSGVREKEIKGRCLFVGSRNLFNTEALFWLLTEIWPSVLRDNKEATLDICGSVVDALSDFDGTHLNIYARGRVPDLAPFYMDAQLVVVPLLRGTGVKTKMINAAGFGKAIVGTEAAFQGLPEMREISACATNAETFSREILKLLNNDRLRHRIGDQLREVVRLNYSPEQVARNFMQMV